MVIQMPIDDSFSSLLSLRSMLIKKKMEVPPANSFYSGLIESETTSSAIVQMMPSVLSLA